MDIVRQTMQGLDIPSVLHNLKPPSDPSSHFIFKQIAGLISSDVKYCQNGSNLPTPSTVYQKLESYKHFVWEKLNTGHWSQLDDAWRALFTIISLARIICISQVQCPPEIESDVCRDVIKICDLGIMMGAALPAPHGDVCGRMAADLTRHLKTKTLVTVDPQQCPLETEKENKPSSPCRLPSDQPLKRKHSTFSVDDNDAIRTEKVAKPLKPSESFPNLVNLEAVEPLSLEEFIHVKTECEKPVLIRGMLDDWPAFSGGERHWTVDYLVRAAGPRTVPVELGGRYTDEDWTQTLMTVEDFVKKYIVAAERKPAVKGYLAQHQFFDQVKELREDFDVPEYCYTSSAEEEGEEEDPDVNIWLGPAGTVSPLHTDPKHNCFCQVFGTKLFRLFPKSQTEYLSAYDVSTLLNNTSEIDLTQSYEEVVKAHPQFAQARGYQCLVQPGDLLYIPERCWHFVRSETVSCSVSFWFK